MYAYKTMAYVHYHIAEMEGNPISEAEAYKRALDSFIYSPDDFMDRVAYNIDHGIVSPVWCLDDASVHFHSYLHLMNVYEYILLAGHFDTLRVVCSSLLITCPNKRRLFKPLREYDQYEMLIYAVPTNWIRKAIGISWFTIPDGRRKFRKRFEDHFSCYVPNRYYEPYLKKRAGYLEQINKLLQKLRKNVKNKRFKKDIMKMLDGEDEKFEYDKEVINAIEKAPFRPDDEEEDWDSVMTFKEDVSLKKK